MPDGGTLTVRVKAKSRGAEDGERTTPPADRYPDAGPKTGAFVVIEIADTGAGITPEVMSKIMEPFFTTKPEGKGTGLGLSICRRIVEGHKGEFSMESEPGKGTLVSIKLPVANGSNRFKPIETGEIKNGHTKTWQGARCR